MTNFVTKLFICWMLTIAVSGSVIAQAEPPKKPDFSVGLFGKGKPILYAKTDDGLPREIVAKGTIVDASISGKYCGFTGATGGTLKLKLSERVEGYNHDFLYVIVLCLAGKENEDLIGKPIAITVKKLTTYPYKSAAKLSNHLDSGETPYYYSTVDGIGGLLSNLKSEL